MNIYYIYAYLRKDGTPYYIGKGKEYRAWDNHKTIRVPKNKSHIVIMESNLTEIGACALERRYILWYGRKDLNTGILANRTDGGDGGNYWKGKKFSDDHRKNIAKSIIGKKHSKETLLKMSINAKRNSNAGKKIKSYPRKPHSEETKRKISESMKNRVGYSVTRKPTETLEITLLLGS
jgi:hypothetical protein